MAHRRIDPLDSKSGVRGTHGLGDAPRESGAHLVGRQGGSASPTGGSRKGGSASSHHLRAGRDARHENEGPVVDDHVRDEVPMHDEATGEEHGFELSQAMGELETTDEWARRRERDAAAALARENDAAIALPDNEAPLGDPERDIEERIDRGLATKKTPGPGPKDRNRGSARVRPS